MKGKIGIARLGFMGKLAAVLVAGVMLACPAMADNAASWSDVRNIINGAGNSGSATVTLTSDVTANETINITNGAKNIVLDLNGHTITRANGVNNVFNLGGSNKLTIRDGKPARVSQTVDTRNVARDTNTTDGTGIALPATYSNGTLTWYETRSTVSNKVYTKETRYRMTAQGGGGINGNGGSYAIINMTNSNATLNIEGGMLYGSDGRAIYMEGSGTLNVSGGYIHSNKTESNSGGAIYVQNDANANLNFTGGVIAGNSAGRSGGALATNNAANITISGSVVFSGNAARGTGYDNSNKSGGGAIFLGANTKAEMSGGLLTHNWGVANRDKQDNYEYGGGAVLVDGQFKMTGGQITSNEAVGGGGVMTVHYGEGTGTFIMTGGIIAGNYARMNEGGGISIMMEGRSNIIGGHITNNVCETTHHWGGGGLFMADNTVNIMKSVLVTNNHAEGFGGGATGCPTGRLDAHTIDFQKHSIAFFDNTAAGTALSGSGSTKNEDHRYAMLDDTFMREGDYYQDYFSALSSVFCCGMLGGEKAMWVGTVDGNIFDCKTHEHGDDMRVSSHFITGLTAHPSESAKNKAREQATVFFTGNSSETHAGGFLCDGYLIVGTHRDMEIGSRMDLKGTKKLEGGTLTNKQFTFELRDASGEIISVGTNDDEGNITFDRRIAIESAGTHVFKLKEKAQGGNFNYDTTEYTITITAQEVRSERAGVDTEGNDEIVQVKFYQIDRVVVKNEKTGTSRTYNDDSVDNAIYHLDFDFAFTNEQVERKTGSLAVKKTVTGNDSDTAKAFSFTVTLSDKTVSGKHGDMTFNKGVATFTLKHGETKTATDLPAGIGYTVTEVSDGYTTSATNATGTISDGQTITATFTNDKSRELLGNLAVKKVVTGNDSDTTKAFSFTIELSDKTVSGKHGDMTFNKGVATFTLKHGETKTATDLPHGATYTVTEVSDGYTSSATNATGTISDGKTITATFTNDKSRELLGSLKVSKNVAGNAGDKTKAFAFKVTLDEPLNGKYGDMTFSNGVANFSLKHGQFVTASNLPAGTIYTVVEMLDDAAYVVTATGASGTIRDMMTVEAAFTNTKNEEAKYGDLRVEKFVKGNAADKTKKFTFIVTLSDASINGKYGDMTFKNGIATIKLADRETAVAKKLPAGISYSVVEEDSEDYAVGATNEKGKVFAGNATIVTFVNTRHVADMPTTGDNSSLALYTALLAISGAALLILVRRKSRA